MLRVAAIGFSTLLATAAIAACNTSETRVGAGSGNALAIAATDVAFTVIPEASPSEVAESGAAAFGGDVATRAGPEIDPDADDEIDSERPDDVEANEDGDGSVINGEYEGGGTGMGTSNVNEGTSQPGGGGSEPRRRNR